MGMAANPGASGTPPAPTDPINAQEELETLKETSNDLRRQLEAIESKIKDLEKE
jgi:hypothetical protein